MLTSLLVNQIKQKGKIKMNLTNNNQNQSENSKLIPIFFATDDNYVPMLAVALYSLVKHSSPTNQYNVYVLNTQKVVVHGPRVVVALATTTLTIHPAGTLMLFRLIRHFDYLFQ